MLIAVNHLKFQQEPFNMSEVESFPLGSSDHIVIWKAARREQYVIMRTAIPEEVSTAQFIRTRLCFWGLPTYKIGTDDKSFEWVDDDCGYANVYESLSDAQEALAWIMLEDTA